MSDERQSVELTSRWWGEHVHRYNEAMAHINPDDTVLDIACGTGFGTNIIASSIRGQVTGGDIAPDAIEECRKLWKRDNIQFKVLDGTRLGFPDQYFDKIVSFETIEHTGKYTEMITEFSRVLKPGGKLILSTPNRDVLSPGGVIVNPYHVQEFTVPQLKDILEASFPYVELMGQRYIRYDNKSWRRKIGRVFERIFLGLGVAKLPYQWRSGFMKAFFGYPLYPQETDFALEKETTKIRKECPVQFAICQK